MAMTAELSTADRLALRAHRERVRERERAERERAERARRATRERRGRLVEAAGLDALDDDAVLGALLATAERYRRGDGVEQRWAERGRAHREAERRHADDQRPVLVAEFSGRRLDRDGTRRLSALGLRWDGALALYRGRVDDAEAAAAVVAALGGTATTRGGAAGA